MPSDTKGKTKHFWDKGLLSRGLYSLVRKCSGTQGRLFAEPWRPPKNPLRRSLTPDYLCFRGGPREAPSFWQVISNLRYSWAPVLFYKASLSWPKTKHPTDKAMRMATEKQGFGIFFCFVFIFKIFLSKSHTVLSGGWSISTETYLPAVSRNEKWNSWHFLP